jgi:hypothetical protein
MTLAPTCAAHCRALCDIGCARVTVARDDDGTDKCNFRYCLPGVLPGVPKKVPIVNRECDELDGPDFSGCEYGRLVFAWLMLSLLAPLLEERLSDDVLQVFVVVSHYSILAKRCVLPPVDCPQRSPSTRCRW